MVQASCKRCASTETSVIRAEIHEPSQSVTVFSYLQSSPWSLQTQTDIFKKYYFERKNPDGSPLVETKQSTTPVKAEF